MPPGQIASFGEFLARAALRERSRSEYAATVRRFTDWASDRDEWPPSDPWQREHLTRDYTTFLRTEKSAAPSTINSTLSALDLLWTHLGLGPSGVRREHIPLQAPRGLNSDEEKRLLREAEKRGVRDHALILLLLMCGPRLDETAMLDVRDLTLTARTGDLHIRHGKGGKQRHVPVPAQARPVLAQWLEHRRGLRGADGTPLWLSRRGGRLSRNGIDEVIRACAAACNPPVQASAHVLRHTAIHRMRNAGMDPFMIAELVGHASVRTTQGYGRPTADEKAQRVDALRVDY